MNNFNSFYNNRKKIFTTEFIILFLLFFICASSIAAPPGKGSWYRYYDKSGVANISSSVSQSHIRHGYDVLDKNMQLIKKIPPYNVEEDLKNAAKRQAQAREKIEVEKAKRAFGNSQVAAEKKEAILIKITQLVDRQNLELKAAYQDLEKLKQQEFFFISKNKPIPIDLKQQLTYNAKRIHDIKTKNQSLQSEYRNTQAEYDIIIKRLKNTE